MLRMTRTTKYVARNTPSASVIVRSLQSREKPCVFRQGPARRAAMYEKRGLLSKTHDAARCRSAEALLPRQDLSNSNDLQIVLRAWRWPPAGPAAKATL